MTRPAEHARAKAVIASSFVWDNHACMPLRPGDGDFLPQLSRVRASGVSAVTLNIGFGEQTPEQHLEMLAWFRRWLADRPDDYLLVRSVADLDLARESGRLGVLFDIEGARGIGDDLGLIKHYRDLGVGWMLLAYNRRNLVGSGCLDEDDEGLSAYGRSVVAEMNRVGMILCLSHTGARTADEAMAVSASPMIFSHSNCAAVYAHPRNISDERIRACAARGGVVGINGIGDFLGPAGTPLVRAMIRHIDHAVQLVGPDHVGLALDYVYDQEELRAYLASIPDLFPEGLPADLPLVPPEQLAEIVEGLIGLGYSDAGLRAILGDNWRRVASANWDATVVSA